MSEKKNIVTNTSNCNPNILFESHMRVIKPTKGEIAEIKKIVDELGMPDTLDYLDD
jgi:hypothetical protein